MTPPSLRWIALCALTVLLAVRTAAAFGYISADESRGVDVINHPSGYTGSARECVVTIGIQPGSDHASDMAVPLQNIVRLWNSLQPNTSNLINGASSGVPPGASDWESVALHEVGHALGLGHPNLGAVGGLTGSERDFARSTDGANNTYDLDAGVDGTPATADDQRGDDRNMTWFRKDTNDPFTLAPTADSSTYSVDITDLPTGHSFASGAGREVAAAAGLDSTEAVMQQGTPMTESQRLLCADDVAAIRYAMSGLDEIAGNSDDYTVRLVYTGTDATAQILVEFDEEETSFSSTRVTSTSLTSTHRAVTAAYVYFNPDVDWYFNDELLTGDPLAIAPSSPTSIQGFQGGPFEPPGTTYTLTNTGPTDIAWTVDHSQPWLTATPASGVLSSGSWDQVSIQLNSLADSLDGGEYTAVLVFSNVSSGVSSERTIALSVRGCAALPLAEGFEQGALSPWWTTSGTEGHRVQVTSEGVPHSGTYHLTLDDRVSGGDYTRSEATLCVDLQYWTNVVLSFWVREYNDESHAPPSTSFTMGADFDGVAISTDEVHWHEVQPLRDSVVTDSYRLLTVDLDAAIAQFGLSHTQRFFIRFNQYDNYPINFVPPHSNGDGLAFDDIAINGTLTATFQALTILGQPYPHGSSSPLDYGEHTVLLGSEITLSAASPVAGTNGERFVCTGWSGTGGVPETGNTNSVTFAVVDDATIAWQWATEYSLVQTSTIPGIVQNTSWHRAATQAATLTAPARVTNGETLYRFSEWRVDGDRHPDSTSPAVNPAHDLPMDSTHVALAIYLPEESDENQNGLRDWFEKAYFGAGGAQPGDDPDGDHANNLHEQIASTDPTDPESVFKVRAFAKVGHEEESHITLGTSPDMFYKVEFRGQAELVWRCFTNQQIGAGSWRETGTVPGVFTFIDDFTTNTSGSPVGPSGTRLYRVRVSSHIIP